MPAPTLKGFGPSVIDEGAVDAALYLRDAEEQVAPGSAVISRHGVTGARTGAEPFVETRAEVPLHSGGESRRPDPAPGGDKGGDTVVVAAVLPDGPLFDHGAHQAPTGADVTRTIDEDDPYIFEAADFGFSDADGDILAAVVIATLPATGRLLLNGVEVTAGQTVSVADIEAGALTYEPAANDNGDGAADFTFHVQDDGGTADGGDDTADAANTFTFDITPVNDAPTLSGFSVSLTVTEGDGPALLDADVTFSDVEGNFDFGFLDVLGGEAEDVVSIRDQGMDAGEIGYDPDTGEVFYGGVLIGFATGGCGCAPLSVEFNADATAEAIDALIQNLTYEYQGDDPAVSRTLFLSVMDADGATIDGDARGFGPYMGDNADDIADIGSYAVSLIDFDGDGDLDMGVSDDVGFVVYRNVGDASVPEFVLDAAFAIDDVFDLPTLIDVDGDGLVDVLFSSPDGVSFHRNTGAGFVEDDSPIEAVLDGTVAMAADYDGDGDLDLIAGNIDEFGEPFGELRLFSNEGGGVFVEQLAGDNPFAGIQAGLGTAMGDVDGDGDADLFVGGDLGVEYFENDGGVFVQQTGFANPLESLPVSLLALGDLTGDGFADFLVPFGGLGTVFGENLAIGMQTFRITVNPVNDDPTAQNNLGASLDEGDSVAIDWTALSFADLDNDPSEVTFTLTGLPANGVLMLDGVVLGLGDTFTQQDIDDDLLSYGHDGSETTSDNFQFDVSDGAGGASDGHSFSFDIVPVEDPTDARGDLVATRESRVLSGDVFADNGLGADADPDGPPLEVIEVNGQAAAVGVQIVLASGALLTLRADGTFDYDPNGVFDDLTAPVTGASNSSAVDGFTYTLAGGATATVQIQIIGEYDGGDTIRGGAGLDVLTGRYGDDVLVGSPGADVMDGGAGFDTLDYSASSERVTVRLWQGFTSSRGDARGDLVSNFETVIGSAFADVLVGSLGDDVLEGGAGGDLLRGFGGRDTARYAGSGSAVTVNLATRQASGGDAQGDTLFDIDNLIGSAFADTLTGDAGDNVIAGGAGADILDGGAGFDTLDYSASSQGVTVRLWQGSTARGDASGDVVSNFEGIIGSALADVLVGTTGDNVLEGGAGGDLLRGFGGSDTASYAGSATGVTVNLATGLAAGGDAAGDTLSDIDNLIGSALADTLTGDAGDNVIAGGAGADILDGGGGFDTLDYSASAEGVTVRLWQGFTSSRGDARGDVVSNFEAIVGSSFADTLIGSGADNILEGGAGADVLKGFGGSDTASYAGSSSGVTVNLAAGAGLGGDAQGDMLSDIDNLIGSAFVDVLTGNTGNNVLTGGLGNDTFVFGAAWGYDVITDFRAGALGKEIIRFESAVFADFADLLAHTADVNGDAVIARDGMSITLSGVTRAQLNAGDFVFAAAGAPEPSVKSAEPQVLPGPEADAWVLPLDDKAGAVPLVMPAEGEGEVAPVVRWVAALGSAESFAVVTDAGGLAIDGADPRLLKHPGLDDWL